MKMRITTGKKVSLDYNKHCEILDVLMQFVLSY